MRRPIAERVLNTKEPGITRRRSTTGWETIQSGNTEKMVSAFGGFRRLFHPPNRINRSGF
jgi:hypothetical protein